MKILAKDFKTREDLEKEVRNLYGLTPTPKPEHTIEGKRADLAKHNLSDKTVFWGISCVITDTPTVFVEPVKVNRGKEVSSGINGRLKKKPKKTSK